MTTTQQLTTHATRRCSQRGLKQCEIEQIFENADVELPIGSNCSLLRVSWKTARSLNLGEKVGRFGLILNEEGVVVTVLPIRGGANGRRYRKA